MNGTRLGTFFLGMALLSACGGNASRAGRHHGTNQAGGEQGVAGAAGANPDGATDGGRPTGGGASPEAGTGGVATGGHSAGEGPGVAGSAGTGGEQSPLPLAPGCEARVVTETATSCSLSAYCTAQSQVTSCGQLPSGRWQCGCELFNRNRTFEVDGATGLRACAVATGLCSADDSEMGEESCITRNDDGSEDACRINLGCSREVQVPFAPGARAWLVKDAEAECYRSELGPALECGCMYRGKHHAYEILAESAADACRPFVDFCMSEGEPDSGGEERCVVMSTESDDDGCRQTRGCASPMPLDEGIDLAQLERRYAVCTPAAAGGADCVCEAGERGTFDFRTGSTPDDATCAFAGAACDQSAEILPTADANCEPQSQNTTGATWCDADLACEQPATIQGDAIMGKGRLIVQCARAAQGQPWLCSCASDQTIAKFPLGAPNASATEACGQAPLACLEHLDLHLGPYGDYLYPPYPL